MSAVRLPAPLLQLPSFPLANMLLKVAKATSNHQEKEAKEARVEKGKGQGQGPSRHEAKEVHELKARLAQTERQIAEQQPVQGPASSTAVEAAPPSEDEAIKQARRELHEWTQRLGGEVPG